MIAENTKRNLSSSQTGILQYPPRHSAAPRYQRCKVRACGVAALLWLACSTAWAQIDVPAESQPYRLITAKLKTPIPEGAYVADGGWEIIGSSATVTADYREYPGELIWTGTPGTYQVLFDGVLLKNVTFKDGDGNQVTIKSYLGRIKARATCTIKGGVVPPPPPPPRGKYQLVFWYMEGQLDNLPQGQRDILTSLVFRDWLRSQGHVLVEVLDPANFSGGSVPPKWQPWVNSIVNKPLPAVSLFPLEGGNIVGYSLPKDVPAMQAFLAAPARKAVGR